MQRGARILRALTSAWLKLGVLALTQLAQIPIALHHLPAEEFGLFSLLSQLIGNLMLIELGVGVAVGRLLIDARIIGGPRLDSLWTSAIVVFRIQAALVFSGMLICTPFISQMFAVPPALISEARWVFLALGVNSIAGYLVRPYSLLLFTAQKLSLANILSTVGVIFGFAAFFVAALSGLRIWSLVIGNTTTTIWNTLTFLIATNRSGLIPRYDRRLLDWAELRHVFHLALELFAFGFFNTFIQNSLLLLAGWQKIPLVVVAAVAQMSKSFSFLGKF